MCAFRIYSRIIVSTSVCPRVIPRTRSPTSGQEGIFSFFSSEILGDENLKKINKKIKFDPRTRCDIISL